MLFRSNVKYHLSQDKTNQSIVAIASRITNQKEVTAVVADLAETVVAEDLVGAEPVDMVEITAVVEVMEETDHHEKCIKQHVEIVVTSVRYLLSQKMLDQSIVMIVSRTINQKDDN